MVFKVGECGFFDMDTKTIILNIVSTGYDSAGETYDFTVSIPDN